MILIGHTSSQEYKLLQLFINLDVIGNIMHVFYLVFTHTDSWRQFMSPTFMGSHFIFYSWLFQRPIHFVRLVIDFSGERTRSICILTRFIGVLNCSLMPITGAMRWAHE